MTARTKFIRAKATDAESDHAKRVADAVGKDMSAIIREVFLRLGKRHGVKMNDEGD